MTELSGLAWPSVSLPYERVLESVVFHMAGESPMLTGVPEAGTLIAGKYRVGEALARGGMGVVCAGTHEALDQSVAIKFLLPESSSRPDIVERFLREARAAAKIHSDHVVRVFDVGSHEGTPYMVMEYLQGGDFSHLLDKGGALPVDEAVEYICQALEAIAEAHRAGIVHRDLKPANLYLALRPDGSTRVKVLDFGISKVDRGHDLNAALTSTHVMLGSPGYMSPEQVRSTKSVDARSDVWSIGVILYEALTGTVAYAGETLGDIFAKIREERLPPLRSLRPEIPAGLEAVVSRCLERDRAARFSDGAALLEALVPFCPDATRRVKRPAQRPALGDSHETSRAASGQAAIAKSTEDYALTVRDGPNAINATNATWSSARESRREGRRWLLAGAGAVLVLCALVALVLVSRSEPTSVTAVSAAAAETSAPPSFPNEPEPRRPSVVPVLPTNTQAGAPTPPSAPPRAGPPPARSAAKPLSSPSPKSSAKAPAVGKPKPNKDDLGI